FEARGLFTRAPARSNVASVETRTAVSKVPSATAAGTGHQRHDARRPSGTSTISAHRKSAKPGSHAQLSSQAAESPAGREAGLFTSASAAYACARPAIAHHNAARAITHDTRLSGRRVVRTKPSSATMPVTPA